jgi:signal transduction histidine kinase
MDDRLTEQDRHHLDLARNRAIGMSRMLEDLLIYARSGVEGMAVETVDVRELALECFDELPDRKDFELTVEDKETLVPVYKSPLKTILSNLFSNVIHHHDRNGGEIRLTVRSDAHQLRLDVGDDGPGIPKALQGKIFRLFHRLKADSKNGNSGAGLAIVKRLIESQDGSIEVVSNAPEERGTIFRMRLPLPSEA